MSEGERRSSDARLAVLETKQDHISAAVEELKSEQREDNALINQKLDKIDNYLSKQKGIIATISAVAIAIWGLVALTVKALWERLLA